MTNHIVAWGRVFGPIALLTAGGCAAPAARIDLLQPVELSAQHRVRLASDWAYFSVAPANRGRCVLHFPLPQSEAGRRVFHAYLETPATEGLFEVDWASPAGVRGFLIQDVGKLRGKTEFVSGTIRAKHSRAAWRIELDIVCEDGTRIVGDARLVEQAGEVAAFRERYAADIAEMQRSTIAWPALDPDTNASTPPTP